MDKPLTDCLDISGHLFLCQLKIIFYFLQQLKAYELSLNVKKTKLLIFNVKNKKENYKDHYFSKIQKIYWSPLQRTIDFTIR